MNIHFTNKKFKKIMKLSSILILIMIVTGMVFNQSCSSASYSTEDTKMKKIVKSAQYKKRIFHNYKPRPKWGIMEMIPMMWDFLFAGNNRKPDTMLPTQQVDFSQIVNAKSDELKVTWIVHSLAVRTEN